MKKILYFILFASVVLSCTRTHKVIRSPRFDYTTEHYEWANEFIEVGRDWEFSVESCKMSGVAKGSHGEKCEYFEVDSADVQSIKRYLNIFFANNDTLKPFKDYFRQYIGYKTIHERYVYVNMFAYFRHFGDAIPDIQQYIYEEDSGGYNFGYVIMNIDTNEIVDIKFKK